MASFVYSSTDAFARFASSSKRSGQALAGTEHCCLQVLEWSDDSTPILGWLKHFVLLTNIRSPHFDRTLQGESSHLDRSCFDCAKEAEATDNVSLPLSMKLTNINLGTE